MSRLPSTRFQSATYRLPKTLEDAIKTPIREAVDEALADASVTGEANEADSDASGEGSTDETDIDSNLAVSTTDDASRSWRRRGLLGLSVLVPVAALAAFAQYRRSDGGSGRAEAIVTASEDGHDEETDVEDGTDTDPISRSAAGAGE